MFVNVHFCAASLVAVHFFGVFNGREEEELSLDVGCCVLKQ